MPRLISLAPDNGIMEDIGPRRVFEEPYWAGEHPSGDPDDSETPYPFPFHPLELGEAALLDLFGYQIEGLIDPSHLDAGTIPLARFKRVRSWWKLW